MKKFLTVLILGLFVMTFAVGFHTTDVQASDPCIGTCLNGTWLICCPDGSGGWDCYWGGPCDWPGWIP
jgi:hypothetical protein